MAPVATLTSIHCHYDHGPGDPVQDMPPQLRGHRASRPPRLGGDGQRHGLGLVRLLPLLFQPNRPYHAAIFIHTRVHNPNAHTTYYILPVRAGHPRQHDAVSTHAGRPSISYLKHLDSLASFALVSSACSPATMSSPLALLDSFVFSIHVSGSVGRVPCRTLAPFAQLLGGHPFHARDLCAIPSHRTPGTAETQ